MMEAPSKARKARKVQKVQQVRLVRRVPPVLWDRKAR